MFIAELIFIHMAGAGGAMQASRATRIMLQGRGIFPENVIKAGFFLLKSV